MTPPQICPPPPDCPLYAQRVDYGPDEPLRRAILTEKKRPGLGELVWADMNRAYQRPICPLPTRPSPPQPALPEAQARPSILDHLTQKGATP